MTPHIIDREAIVQAEIASAKDLLANLLDANGVSSEVAERVWKAVDMTVRSALASAQLAILQQQMAEMDERDTL